MKYVHIAIDGPAGAGKSTIAKKIAHEFNYTYIDTGSMYRAIVLKALTNKINIDNEEEFGFVKDIEFKFVDGHLHMDNKDVSDRVRNNDISNNVSKVSAYHSVRKQLVEVQQKMAQNTDVVMDGRDIGYKVLPNAKYKFFLTASIEKRAERRQIDNDQRGITSSIETLREEIARRDYLDTTREFSPLRPASDAIIIDTSDLNIDEVVKIITDKIREVE